MKNVIYAALALIAVWLVWKLLMFVLHAVLAPLITIGVILLFCFLAFALYKAVTRQKEIV